MNKQGFTLIELLVVVLIIGILSAVALPQYSKAVDKARGTEALTMAKAIVDAQNLYYLQSRKYTTDFSALPIQIEKEGKHFKTSGGYTFGSNDKSYQFSVSEKNNEVYLDYILEKGKVKEWYCGESSSAYMGQANGCRAYFGLVAYERQH